MIISIRSTIANLTSSTSSPSRFSTSLSAPTVYTNLGQDYSSQSPPPGHLETSPKARALRRAARAALVDAYRRFVLSELTRRLPAYSYRDTNGHYQGVYGGGFCVWILHSMRRRAQDRIDQLFEEAQMFVSEEAHDRHVFLSGVLQLPEQSGAQVQPLEIELPSNPGGLEETAPVEEEEDETTTETDGSSVRTPSSGSHLHDIFVRLPTSTSSHSQMLSSADLQTECQHTAHEPDSLFPTTPSPSPPNSPTPPTSPTLLNSPSSPRSDDIPSPMPVFSSRPTSSTLSQNLSGAALLEYNELSDLRERLWQLAMFAESQNRIVAEEVRSRLEVLTVRSRRRAWSAGEFRIGRGAQARNCQTNVAFSSRSQYGFSVPFRSSPLARFSCTAEDLEKEYEMNSERSSSRDSVFAVADFPSYPRCFTAAKGEIDGVSEGERAEDPPLVDGEFELYEEFPGPSPLDMRGRRGRRHNRRKDLLEMGIGTGSVHRLFPVSEELEGEGEEAVDLEFRVALGGGIAAYGPARGRRIERTGRTFMGCDDVAVEGDEDEEKIGHSQETLVDDDGLVDPRELDIELGFGFDFHQQGSGRGFLGHDDLFEDDDDDDEEDDEEDEFKFDLSSQLERPKIRPRVRTSSIFMPKDATAQPLRHKNAPITRIGGSLSQPANFASSSHNLLLFSSLSKSPPLRSGRAAPSQVSSYPILDISRTTTPASIPSPEVAEIEIRLVDDSPCSSTHSSSLNPHLQVQNSSSLWRSVTPNANVMKSLPAAPLPIHVPLEIGIHDGGPEEFTLAMDLPRAVTGGGVNGANGSHSGASGAGKKWMKTIPAAQPSPGRSLKLFNDAHGSMLLS